ncbi:MAG: NADPH-dependent F420 reductase [Dehalococcoidia bacterium]|nr:NADPH-dependent F420 reductase [Dehalococcoidia bacterium]
MIGFIGGTGPEGKGLALRFAMAGERVAIGSRDAQRAQDAAHEVGELQVGLSVTGGLNEQVADESDIVVIAVPYSGHRPTLESLGNRLDGKLVVDVVAPLRFSRGVASAVEVEEGSAAQQAQILLPNSKVVGAFHNLSAEDLMRPNVAIVSDVIVCADDKEAKIRVMELAESIEAVRAVDGGGLQNSRYVEELTALLININRIYKAHSTIKIVGI